MNVIFTWPLLLLLYLFGMWNHLSVRIERPRETKGDMESDCLKRSEKARPVPWGDTERNSEPSCNCHMVCTSRPRPERIERMNEFMTCFQMYVINN